MGRNEAAIHASTPVPGACAGRMQGALSGNPMCLLSPPSPLQHASQGSRRAKARRRRELELQFLRPAQAGAVRWRRGAVRAREAGARTLFRGDGTRRALRAAMSAASSSRWRAASAWASRSPLTGAHAAAACLARPWPGHASGEPSRQQGSAPGALGGEAGSASDDPSRRRPRWVAWPPTSGGRRAPSGA
eukprot:CAMPEP_0179894454 /NCGR_PEP_ID=MMETSP0982-20121206/35296_1 /TAXON_ID=483367 /ORGANISM="non described non described, Strain CCMP 2436" /LENGTH=189 /DNA_ID=CAMNT_0021791049 /DNA_START=69 /DNA_END=634 /DNA_ORIENTATION=+